MYRQIWVAGVSQHLVLQGNKNPNTISKSTNTRFCSNDLVEVHERSKLNIRNHV